MKIPPHKPSSCIPYQKIPHLGTLLNGIVKICSNPQLPNNKVDYLKAAAIDLCYSSKSLGMSFPNSIIRLVPKMFILIL